MTKKYAERTKVPISTSKSELEKICNQHGATNFSIMQGDTITAIIFKYLGRLYRIDINFKGDDEKEQQRKWRVIVITLKVMFESITNNVIEGQLLFQPWTVLPGNTVLHSRISPQIEQAYLTGKMPTLLPEEQT
jgi:undecaprenyl pyrophosphate phosphatase UppP